MTFMEPLRQALNFTIGCRRFYDVHELYVVLLTAQTRQKFLEGAIHNLWAYFLTHLSPYIG